MEKIFLIKKSISDREKLDVFIRNPAMGTCPSMTILENMSLADNKGKKFGLGFGTNKKRVDYYRELLSQLGLGLEDMMGSKVGSLSGGTETGNGTSYDNDGTN